VTYPADIKTRVQELVNTGLSIREAARQTNVSPATAVRWAAQKAVNATAPARNLLAEKLADDGELSKLRRENQLLRQLVATLLSES
jgi:transposase-like protein